MHATPRLSTTIYSTPPVELTECRTAADSATPLRSLLKTGGGGGDSDDGDGEGGGDGYTLLAMNVDAAGSIIGRFTFPAAALQG